MEKKLQKQIWFFVLGVTIFSHLCAKDYFADIPKLEDFAQYDVYKSKSKHRWVTGLGACAFFAASLAANKISDATLKKYVGLGCSVTGLASGIGWIYYANIKHGLNADHYAEFLKKKFFNLFEDVCMTGLNQSVVDHMPLNEFNSHAHDFESVLCKLLINLNCLKSLMFYCEVVEKYPAGFKVSSEENLKRIVSVLDEKLLVFIGALDQKMFQLVQTTAPVDTLNVGKSKSVTSLNLPLLELYYGSELCLYFAKERLSSLSSCLSEIKALILSISDQLEHVYSGKDWISSFIQNVKKIDSVLMMSSDIIPAIMNHPNYVKQVEHKKALDKIAHDKRMRELEAQKKAAEIAAKQAEAEQQIALAADLKADASKRDAEARAKNVETAGKVIGGVLDLFQKPEDRPLQNTRPRGN